MSSSFSFQGLPECFRARADAVQLNAAMQAESEELAKVGAKTASLWRILHAGFPSGRRTGLKSEAAVRPARARLRPRSLAIG